MLPDLRRLSLECTRHGAEVGQPVECSAPGMTDDDPEAVRQAAHRYLEGHKDLEDLITQKPLSDGFDGVDNQELWDGMVYYWNNGIKTPVVLPEAWKKGPTSLIGITPKCRPWLQTGTTSPPKHVMYALKATLYIMFSNQRRKDPDTSSIILSNNPKVMETRTYPQAYKDPLGRGFIVPTLTQSNGEAYTEMDNVLRDFLQECQSYRHREDRAWNIDSNSLYSTIKDASTGSNPFPVGQCGWEDPEKDPDGQASWGAVTFDNVERDEDTGLPTVPDSDPDFGWSEEDVRLLEEACDAFDDDCHDNYDDDDDDDDDGNGDGEEDVARVAALLHELQRRPETHANPVPSLKALYQLVGDPVNALEAGQNGGPIVDVIRCAHVQLEDALLTIVWGLRILIKILSRGNLEDGDRDAVAAHLLNLTIMPVLVDLLRSEHRPSWKPQRIRTLSADLLNRIFQTNVSDSAIVLFNQRKWLGLETATELFVDGDDQVDYAHYLKLMWHVLQHEKRNPTFKNNPTSRSLLMFASPTPVKLRQIIRTVVPNSNDEDFFNSLRKTAKEVLVMLYWLRDL